VIVVIKWLLTHSLQIFYWVEDFLHIQKILLCNKKGHQNVEMVMIFIESTLNKDFFRVQNLTEEIERE